jgi:hypothetical protein
VLMPRLLRELLDRLEQAFDSDADRRACAGAARPAAGALAPRLPLVHRTGTDSSWRAIFADWVLKARDVGSAGERALGHERAVYCFVGCGAYPKGNVALIFAQALAGRDDATFTPFDSGALDGYCAPEGRDPGTWAADERQAFLADHLGQGRDLGGFLGPFLAAHFRDPAGYVEADHVAEPDFPAYHGLVSTTGDRRAWTAEVQIHGDVPIPGSPASLTVLLEHGDLRRDLPSAALRMTRVVRSRDDKKSSFTALIARHVLDSIPREDE